MKSKRILLILTAAFMWVFQAMGQPGSKVKNFYVATNGSDNAVGSKAAPFKTLYKAQKAIQALQPIKSPVNVWIRGGIYYFDKPLVFSAADNGSENAPITYSAYPKETVIISGGVKLTPKWTTYSGDIMVADIGKGYSFDMLFYNNDKLLTLARYPNYDASKVPLQGCANISSRIPNWSNPAGGFIRAMHVSGWGGESYIITGKKGTELQLKWVGDNNRGSVANPNRQVAENIFEELDAPGEWFYNTTTGKLYFYPQKGMDINKAVFTGATQEELIKFVGSSKQKVKYLNFSGFTFTHTHRTLFTRPYEGLSQGDWAIARAGTVFMQDAEHIEIKNCDFPNIGGNGVFMSGYNRNNSVTNCDFVHIGATAVAIAGLPGSTWYYCNWDNNHQVPTNLTNTGPATEDYPSNINVSYCYVYDNGMFEKQTAAMLISMSQSVTVSHCTAHYGPRSGINIEDGTFGGHIIEYNTVFNEVRETGDHGPFNSWGRDRWWSRTKGQDARKYALLDAVKPNTIHNNLFHNPPGHASYGIDLDDGSTNYVIYNNLLVNCGVKSQLGFNHTITNNILINSLATLHQWSMPDMQKIIAHNIIVNKSPYYCRTRDFMPNTGKIDSNLFWNNGASVVLQIDAGKGNGGEISAAATWAKYGLDAHSVTEDPQFVDAAKGIYSVKSSSPALALGFKNFLMNQFGKPGYPVPPGFERIKTQLPIGRYAIPQLNNGQKTKDSEDVDLGPLDMP